MKSWRALRALARVELRQLNRHRARSLLIVLLVAVPVAAIVGGATLARITEPTSDEQRTHVMGQADMRLDAVNSQEDHDKLTSLLPRTAIVERLFLGTDSVRVPGRRLRSRVVAVERVTEDFKGHGRSGDLGLAAGMLQVLEGRVPANPGEVAMSSVLVGAATMNFSP